MIRIGIAAWGLLSLVGDAGAYNIQDVLNWRQIPAELRSSGRSPLVKQEQNNHFQVAVIKTIAKPGCSHDRLSELAWQVERYREFGMPYIVNSRAVGQAVTSPKYLFEVMTYGIFTSAFILQADRETHPGLTIQRWRSVPSVPAAIPAGHGLRPSGLIRAINGIWLQEAVGDGIRVIYGQDVEAVIAAFTGRILDDFESGANQVIDKLVQRCR